MAREKKFFNLTFSRLNDLLELRLPGELREITYVANCTNFRRLLLNRYGDTDISIDERIANDPDTKLTYLGYRRFLESDLRHIFLCGTDLTKNGYKRDVKFLAKEMLLRGHVSSTNVLLQCHWSYMPNIWTRLLRRPSSTPIPTTYGFLFTSR